MRSNNAGQAREPDVHGAAVAALAQHADVALALRLQRGGDAGGHGGRVAEQRVQPRHLPRALGVRRAEDLETARGDEAVGINSVERFLGDEAIRHGWTVSANYPPTGKRVLVVGAGPSGLSAAYHLARLGHRVEIHEAGPRAGGMMRFGIPAYRLPRDVLDAEIRRILDLGVTLHLDRTRARSRARHRRLPARRALPPRPGDHTRALRALNPWYYDDAPRTLRPTLELARRQSTFEEVTGGLDTETALFEARRCMSCGNCFACDNCYGVCPDNAVIKLEPGGAYAYTIDLDYCKGCALCVQECPAGAIAMEPEPI